MDECKKCIYYDKQGNFCSLTGKDIEEHDECVNLTEKE